MIPLKDLRKLQLSLEMPLINCEIDLDLNGPKKCVTVATAVANQSATFSITDRKTLCCSCNFISPR